MTNGSETVDEPRTGRMDFGNPDSSDPSYLKFEQQYHLSMRRWLNAHLHTWGIIDGLSIEVDQPNSQVIVSGGVAIDKFGQEIVVVESDDNLNSFEVMGQRDGGTAILQLRLTAIINPDFGASMEACVSL